MNRGRRLPSLFRLGGARGGFGVEVVGSFTHTHFLLTRRVDTPSAVCGEGTDAVGPGCGRVRGHVDVTVPEQDVM